jgi:hypothetical protein
VRIGTDMNVRHLILKTQIHPHEFCGFEFLLNSCPMLEKITLDIGQRAIFPVSQILYISYLFYSSDDIGF